MVKRKCATVLIVCLIAAATVNAATVFNVDINGEDANGPGYSPYGQMTGGAPGAFNDVNDGRISTWNVYVDGPYGKRLIPTSIPQGANWAGTKAYIGWDPCTTSSLGFSAIADQTLFGDYAYKTGSVKPRLSIIGSDANTIEKQINGQGFFDVYVFSSAAGTIDVNGTPVTLSGLTPADASFTLGRNYGVVTRLDSSKWINIDIGNQLAGLQLVDRGIKVPNTLHLAGDPCIPASAGTDFSPTWASFAYDISTISAGPFLWHYEELQEVVPGVWIRFELNLLAGTYPGEWVMYDMYVDEDPNAGFYEINCAYTNMNVGAKIGFQVDNGPTNVLTLGLTGNWEEATKAHSPFTRLYLSKGDHRLKVSIIDAGSNVWGFRIRRADNQTVSNCFDAQLKGSELLSSDSNGDCIVNFKDLAEFASQWLTKCAGCP